MTGGFSQRDKVEEGSFNELEDIQNWNSAVEEMLKRFSWAAVSVPAPNVTKNTVKRSLSRFTPEELLKIRATAAQLEIHHMKVLDYLRTITEVVYDNGYLAPVKVK